MTGTTARAANVKLWLWLAIGACLLFIAGANAHLVYVAVSTQPDCVAHVREGEGAAAKSACRPQ